jgi:Zn finger protein HypA/HybF involved in hydrogenase expression
LLAVLGKAKGGNTLLNGIFARGIWYESTDKKCRRCGSPVWHSDLPQYDYQCFRCDEDLYAVEVEAQSPDYHSRVVVAKHIEDITLNPFQFLIDSGGNLVIFDNQAEAEKFLRVYGFTIDAENSILFVEIDTQTIECPACKHTFLLNSARCTEAGLRTVCKECGAIFGIDLTGLDGRSEEKED